MAKNSKIGGDQHQDDVESKGWGYFPIVRKSVFTVGSVAVLYQAGVNGFIGPIAHTYSTSMFFGCNVWTTFFSGLIMWSNMKPIDFGKLQTKLFPWYFGVLSISALMGIFSMKCESLDQLFSFKFLPMLTCLLTSVLNLFVLGPLTEETILKKYAILEEKMGKESEERVAKYPEVVALSKKFGMLHGISSLLNMFGLIGIMYHMYSTTASS